MRFLIDTNILVRLKDLTYEHHILCYEKVVALRTQNTPLYICAQVLIEYWNVSTRPIEHNGLGQTTEETFQDCQDFLRMFMLLMEPIDIVDRWLDLVRRYDVKGRQVHDARLVALAMSYNIDYILTINTTDYIRYSEVTAVHPNAI
jgi:predicted nucleic acid-binding protein